MISDLSVCRQEARDMLSGVPGHRKTVLLWAGISAGVSLAVILLQFVLEAGSASFGGIRGATVRALLETLSQFLPTVMLLATPFWSMGYLACVWKLSQEQKAAPGDLLEGFRRWGSVIAITLAETALTMAAVFAASFAVSFIMTFTPQAGELMELSASLPQNPATMDPQAMEAYSQQVADIIMPYMFVAMGLAVILLVPVFYRMRFSGLLIMGQPRMGALQAIAESFRITKGNCKALLKLDLSFWYFYLALAGISVLSYLDVILPALGITLPFSENTAFFLAALFGQLLQLLLFYCMRNRIEVTYALACRTLRTPIAQYPQFPPQA